MDNPATDFIGVPVSWQVFGPDRNTPATQRGTAVVSQNVIEFPDTSVLANLGQRIIGAEIDIFATTIVYTALADRAGLYASTPFNGHVYSDLDDKLPDIIGVQVRAGNTVDLTPGRVSFDANNISINVSGLRYEPGDQYILDVAFAPPAEEDENDEVTGTDDDETFDPGPGYDIIIALGGIDTVNLRALDGAATDLFSYDGATYYVDAADRSFDRYTDVELLSADGRTILTSILDEFDPLDYIASHADLVQAFGADAQAGLGHYVFTGFSEGREVTFDAGQYLANWADLRVAFGDSESESAARAHYIATGIDENRLAIDPLAYVASFQDLSESALGKDVATIRAEALAHYAVTGADQGRLGGVDFDADQYLANWADLRAAFGGDTDAATLHYIRTGRSEGRLYTDPLDYLASHADLIQAFGDIEQYGGRGIDGLRDAGLSHYSSQGVREGRAIDTFDVSSYLSNYQDLRVAVPGEDAGYDEVLATAHFIVHGYDEGRTDDLILL